MRGAARRNGFGRRSRVLEMTTKGERKNLLADSLSPYLRQHADNPVHWREWGADALARAAAEDKPILLSVGYAACHWCHVMAHESFADEETAALMNEHFINIKADREERPDLDRIYQAAHYVFARRGGGWPLTMFLTPDGAPFFGGTYFPKRAGRGLPSFRSVLEKVNEAWRDKRDEIENQNARVLSLLRSLDSHPDSGEAMTDAPARAGAQRFREMFCPEHGGFRGAPKFPHPSEIEFCMRAGAAFGDGELLSAVQFSLHKMAAGGLADHPGGGFFRYCTDERWTIPHFEKMLYDNGLLLSLFADAARVFDSTEFARAAEGIAQWTLDEMRGAGGGFYSSLDADSEGGEGAFYVWDEATMRAHLSDAEYAAIESHFALAAGANFEGRHHLARRQTAAQTAAALNIAPDECEKTVASALAKLKGARDLRPRPATDDKILAAWNGLMIRGLARAGRIMRRPQWIAAARDALHFVRREMTDGGVLFAAQRGGQRGHRAFLDDCAFMLDAALELLRADFCADILDFARALAEQLQADFEDAARGGFFFTPAGGETLIRRPKIADDDATPSGNGVAARALAALSSLLAEPRYADAAEKTLSAFYGAMRERPAGCASLLSALQMYLSPPTTVLLYGDSGECERWREELSRAHPDALVYALPENAAGLPDALQKPRPETGARGYVCREFSCLPPADSLDALKELLRENGENFPPK